METWEVVACRRCLAVLANSVTPMNWSSKLGSLLFDGFLSVWVYVARNAEFGVGELFLQSLKLKVSLLLGPCSNELGAFQSSNDLVGFLHYLWGSTKDANVIQILEFDFLLANYWDL